MFGFYCYSYEPVKYGSDYHYPKWAEMVGLAISFSSMMWVPVYAIYYILTQPGSIMEVMTQKPVSLVHCSTATLQHCLMNL